MRFKLASFQRIPSLMRPNPSPLPKNRKRLVAEKIPTQSNALTLLNPKKQGPTSSTPGVINSTQDSYSSVTPMTSSKQTGRLTDAFNSTQPQPRACSQRAQPKATKAGEKTQVRDLRIVTLTTPEEMNENFESLIRPLYPEEQFPSITAEAYPQMLAEMVEHGYKQFVVRDDKTNEAVGLAGFYHTMVPYMGGRVTKLVDFSVLETCQGLGIGKQLLQEVEKAGRRNKCVKLVLDTSKFREETISIYEKLGFESPRILFERFL